MIHASEVCRIGTLQKPHGIGGEFTFAFENDSFDQEEVEFLILQVEGILVPFVVESYRFKGADTAILKLEGIDSAEQARHYSNTEVYLLRHQLLEDEEGETLASLIGYTVTDEHHGTLGTITAVDESTLNALFIIEGKRGEVLLPAQDEFVLTIDREERLLTVCVPEGLLNLEADKEVY